MAAVESAFPDPIGLERREHAERVRRAREDPTAFQPSGIWLPPLWLANAERSIEWIGLLWLDVSDFEDGTRTRLLPPFMLCLDAPEERTLITPVHAEHADLEGRAGFTGPWLWRRDRLASSDVVFPLLWSFRERDLEDGPDARSSGALLPLAFWSTGANGWSFHLFPFVDASSVGDDHLRWQVMGGLFGHESRGERERWRICWVWTDPDA